jgi:hypothetical protein
MIFFSSGWSADIMDRHKKKYKVDFVLDNKEAAKLDSVLARTNQSRQHLLEIVLEALTELPEDLELSRKAVPPLKFKEGQGCLIRVTGQVHSLFKKRAGKKKFSMGHLARVGCLWAIELCEQKGRGCWPLDKEEYKRWIADQVRYRQPQPAGLWARLAGWKAWFAVLRWKR